MRRWDLLQHFFREIGDQMTYVNYNDCNSNGVIVVLMLLCFVFYMRDAGFFASF